MMNQLSQTQRRALAVFLLLLTLAAGAALLLWPAWMQSQKYDRLTQETMDKLQRIQRLAGKSPKLRAALADLAPLEDHAGYWPDDPPALVAANMQAWLKKQSELQKFKIVSIQVQSPKEDGGHPVQVLNVQITATQPAMLALFDAMQRHEPYLFIDHVTLQSEAGPNYQAQPKLEPEFNLEFELAGYQKRKPS